MTQWFIRTLLPDINYLASYDKKPIWTKHKSDALMTDRSSARQLYQELCMEGLMVTMEMEAEKKIENPT